MNSGTDDWILVDAATRFGGSAYDVLGGEAKITISGQGYSVCAGVGVGAGAQADVGTASGLDQTGFYGKVQAAVGPSSADLELQYNVGSKCSSGFEGSGSLSYGPVSVDNSGNLTLGHSFGAGVEASATVGACYQHGW